MSGSTAVLVRTLEEAGATLVGFADVRRLDEQARQGLPRAVSIGVALTPQIIADIADGPNDAYWDEYLRVNALLLEIAQAGAAVLAAAGYRAVPLPATGDIDTDTLSVPFQHKTAARLAGFGWIGRCALLINPDYGAAVRWGTILTDAPLAVAAAPQPVQCGDCTVCRDVCPGQAPSGALWHEGMARGEFFDALACLRGMQQITAARGTASQVCGRCVANCPYTVGYLRRALA